MSLLYPDCKCDSCKNLKQKIAYNNLLTGSYYIYSCQLLELGNGIIEKCIYYEAGEPTERKGHDK